MNATLKAFEEMAQISTKMVAAAVANDWDGLTQLERSMLELRKGIAILEPAGAQLPGLDAAEQQRKAELITHILEDAEVVRIHVDPWMASTRKLLSDGARDRAVRNAYGALGP